MNGTLKSQPEDIVLKLIVETLRDGYAALDEVFHDQIRKRDLQRDVDYLTTRFAHEGVSFLTTVLPKLGEYLDGMMWGAERPSYEGFAPFIDGRPAFLRPFWAFFAHQASLEAPAHATKIYRILRTIFHGQKKLDVPCGDERTQAAFRKWITNELEIRTECDWEHPALRRAQVLLDTVLVGYSPTIDRPRHGPGAVAGRERNHAKWTWSSLYDSVHREWPYYEYMYPVRSTVLDTVRGGTRSLPLQLAFLAKEYRGMTRIPSPTARMLLVPKDSRGPRIISAEPKELMYLQQGCASHLVRFLERHGWTSGHVNFSDQSVNAGLALTNSESRDLATIDLSDASDRVSCKLIRYLFPKEVSRKWLALRSTHVDTPFGVLPLEKFAPMGSALCFPVEALVFWAVCVASVWEQTNDLAFARRSVFVYGDDILCPSAYYHGVVEALEAANLRVNSSKSFHGDHPFRESCGVDAYLGNDVTPLRIRKLPPSRPSDGEGITAWIQYAENSLAAGLTHRGEYALKVVEELVGRVPRVPFPQPFLACVTPDSHWSLKDYGETRWDPHSCYFQAKVKATRRKSAQQPLDPWKRLQHDLILGHVEADPSVVVEPKSTQIRRCWCNILYL